MGKTATNIAIVLGLITVAFAAYYLYTQKDATVLDTGGNEQVTQNILNNTRVFIERRQTLDQVELDISLLDDDRFRSLRSFTQDIEKRPVGRPDPFAETTARSEASF